MAGSPDALQKRLDRLLMAKGLQGIQIKQKLVRYVQEGLYRKIAIARENAINYGELPADFSEQCRAIDQDTERRMTPTERAVRAAYQGKDIESLAAYKKKMGGLLLECYRPDVIDALIEQCTSDIEMVYDVRFVN